MDDADDLKLVIRWQINDQVPFNGPDSHFGWEIDVTMPGGRK